MESVLFDGLIGVHYGFIQVYSESEDWPDSENTFRGQTNGLLGGAHPGHLFVSVGLHTGDVHVRVVLHDVEPALGDWEDIVEVSFRPRRPTSGCWDSTKARRSNFRLPHTAHVGPHRTWMRATSTASPTSKVLRQTATNSLCGPSTNSDRMRSFGRPAIRLRTGTT